jgi:plastocyanin domain-containing protein
MIYKRRISVRAAAATVGIALACAPGCTKDTASPTGAVEGAQRLEIEVGAGGYAPTSVEATAGRPIILVFRRTTDDTCGAAVMIPSLGIERDLPQGESVEVAIPARSPGKVEFTCAMDMMRGVIEVK